LLNRQTLLSGNIFLARKTCRDPLPTRDTSFSHLFGRFQGERGVFFFRTGMSTAGGASSDAGASTGLSLDAHEVQCNEHEKQGLYIIGRQGHIHPEAICRTQSKPRTEKFASR
jgi:hypothetical protein